MRIASKVVTFMFAAAVVLVSLGIPAPVPVPGAPPVPQIAASAR